MEFDKQLVLVLIALGLGFSAIVVARTSESVAMLLTLSGLLCIGVAVGLAVRSS